MMSLSCFFSPRAFLARSLKHSVRFLHTLNDDSLNRNYLHWISYKFLLHGGVPTCSPYPGLNCSSSITWWPLPSWEEESGKKRRPVGWNGNWFNETVTLLLIPVPAQVHNSHSAQQTFSSHNKQQGSAQGQSGKPAPPAARRSRRNPCP